MPSKDWYVYILHCQDGSFYTGYTDDVQKRFIAHQSGQGARYTRQHKPVEILWQSRFSTRSQAMKEEYRIKKLSRLQKEQWLSAQGVVISPCVTVPNPDRKSISCPWIQK